MKRIITSAFTEGRFEFDGETYIPEASIEDINKKHNTSYVVVPMFLRSTVIVVVKQLLATMPELRQRVSVIVTPVLY